jgi:hypothetical protein
VSSAACGPDDVIRGRGETGLVVLRTTPTQTTEGAPTCSALSHRKPTISTSATYLLQAARYAPVMDYFHLRKAFVKTALAWEKGTAAASNISRRANSAALTAGLNMQRDWPAVKDQTAPHNFSKQRQPVPAHLQPLAYRRRFRSKYACRSFSPQIQDLARSRIGCL